MKKRQFDTKLKEKLRNKDNIKLKNLPNKRYEDNCFIFEDYFDLDVVSNFDEDYISSCKKEFFSIYSDLAESNKEFVNEYRESEEDNKLWAYFVIEVPDDQNSAKDLIDSISESIVERWNI